MTKLNKSGLLNKLLDAFASAGWSASAIESDKPFVIRAIDPSGRVSEYRIFIWNCTHGGGAARPADEYRIQFTGKMPAVDQERPTLLLGWYDENEVFAAWDITAHDGQAGNSPSAQIKQDVLLGAHREAFAHMTKDNGEIAIAFRPEFLSDYAVNSQALHHTERTARDFALLNRVSIIDEEQLRQVANPERREIIATIARRYRSSDFRRRVLSAYGHRCALCGIQLDLIDAAHIEPVSQNGSTDETSNGIALCKLHHAAFDNLLISFDENYRVQISQSKMASLTASGRDGGVAGFTKILKNAILLPADRRDYPNVAYIKRSRSARGWTD